MEKIIIVAMTQDGIIGKDNKIPWHYTEDFQHFKEQTMGYPVVMGSSTYKSLPDKSRPLEGRKNIVLTRSGVDLDEDFVEVSSFEKAWIEAEKTGKDKVFIAGGRSIYEQTLEEADKMIITFVKDDYDGDTKFPKWNEDNWDVEKTRETEDLVFKWFVSSNRESGQP